MTEPNTAPSSPLEAGRAALAHGEWRTALERFDALLAEEDSAEAHEGRALASWWLEDGDAVIESRHAAYQLYQERGEDRSAARVAMRLAEAYGIFRGDISVVRGWLARAERLLDGQAPSPELARLATFKAGMAPYVGDRAEARRLSREAAATARATAPRTSACTPSPSRGGRSSPRATSPPGWHCSTRRPRRPRLGRSRTSRSFLASAA